jgi:hypothetical protein
VRKYCLDGSEENKERRRLAKVGMLETVDSKSKSKPSMVALPKGRRAEVLVGGPKVCQRELAPAMAAESLVNPPSV